MPRRRRNTMIDFGLSLIALALAGGFALLSGLLFMIGLVRSLGLMP